MASRLWESFNCYLVLEVAPTSSPQELKSAWRAVSRKNHPDLGGSHDAMVRVNVAYDVLSDPVARVAHDLFWRIGAAARPREPRPQARPAPTGSPRQADPYRGAEPTRDPTPRAKEGSRGSEPLGSVRARVRERINVESAQIREEVSARAAKFAAQHARAVADYRRSAGYAVVGFALCSALGLAFRLAFIGSAVAAFSLISSVGGPRIQGERRPVFLPSRRWATRKAESAAQEETERAVAGLERYIADLASMIELVMRDSTFDDSESQVARRITVAIFLLGYVPVSYSGTERTLEFSAGDERILVRFRHRDGAAVNVTIPQKLATMMSYRGVTRGFLFCSPGLSGNAAAFAAEHRIHAYTIESMNSWIDETLNADYSGPEGDILAHLDGLKTFLAGLARVLPEHRAPSGQHRRRPRRRRRYW
jgi:curved DNA-binding protein CbpA